MSAILISSRYDWEGLFVNGKLVYQNHEIDRRRLQYICKQYKLDFTKIKQGTVTEEYDEYLYNAGGFDENLEEVKYELDDDYE